MLPMSSAQFIISSLWWMICYDLQPILISRMIWLVAIFTNGALIISLPCGLEMSDIIEKFVAHKKAANHT